MKKLFLSVSLVAMCLLAKSQAPEKIYTVKLSLSQINTILTSLGQQKMADVFDTYMTLRLQTQDQATTPPADTTKKQTIPSSHPDSAIVPNKKKK